MPKTSTLKPFAKGDLAANIWTGVAARIDIDNEEIVQLVDTGFTAPFRSLAGLAVFTGGE